MLLCMTAADHDQEPSRWRKKLEGERLQLVELILKHAESLGDEDGGLALRQAFIEYRYACELGEWRKRRNNFRFAFYAASIGTATLGVLSSGLVAATTSSARSTSITITLIVIGVLVALLTAVNQLMNPRSVAAEYKCDEFALRMRGWQYLRELEEGTVSAKEAYATFQREASGILEKEHRALS
jgi:hypothetical protein